MRPKVRAVLDVSSTLVVSVVAIAMLIIFLQDRNMAESPWGSNTEPVEDWRAWSVSGIRVGPEEAEIVVTVFTDFQCPFCGSLVPILDSLASAFPDRLAVEHQHFPLDGHNFAIPSSIAAECAHRQEAFTGMYRTLFSQQSSIGEISWDVFASEAGVKDLAAFQECMLSTIEDFPRITAGRALGERIGVLGTPSVWINGRLYRGERSFSGFRKAVEDLGL